MDKTEPTFKYSFRLILTPLRFIVSSHMRIAKEPNGKKCGPRLLPMMLEKTSPVNACPVKPAVAAACLIAIKPRIVMGQLFMKLASTVTTKVGASTLSTEGNVLVAVNNVAAREFPLRLGKPSIKSDIST